MSAIALQQYFTKEHIEGHRFGASAALAEQAVHCLELVACLVKAGLSFQFKGGNSLLLILAEPKRFSIDVDIATDEPRERIEACLDSIVKGGGVFARWDKRQHKTKPWIPIASYYLFYNSHFAAPADAFIMLDVQLRRSPYATEQKAVACGEVYQSSVLVEIPLPASIIGDKLLTLGPNTLGIPVGKGKEAQRLKHVFDISELLATGPRLAGIRKSFYACIEHENSIQERVVPTEMVLEDTVAFCASTAKFGRPPALAADTPPILAENVRGLEPFAAHLFEKHYSWQRLQRDMARVAVCMAGACIERVDEGEFSAALAGGPRRSAGGIGAAAGLACEKDVAGLWAAVIDWLGKDLFAGPLHPDASGSPNHGRT